MNRRHFLRTTTATALAFAPSRVLLALEADNVYRKQIGIQLYTLRNQIGKDLPGTMKQVAAAGYRQVEGYGFPGTINMIKAAKDVGLSMHSSHFESETVVNPKDEAMSDFQKILEQAKEHGLSHLVIPYLQDRDRKTLDAYKKVAGNLNKAAVLAKEAGIQLAYHNHNFEFAPLEGGKCGYDVFIEAFSSDMKFEVDVFWVKMAGLEPADLIGKLKGRVSQLHLKDLKTGSKTPNYGKPDGPDAFQALGEGCIPMEPILTAAKASGVVHCHVEQDQSPDPVASVGRSVKHLGTL